MQLKFDADEQILDAVGSPYMTMATPRTLTQIRRQPERELAALRLQCLDTQTYVTPANQEGVC